MNHTQWAFMHYWINKQWTDRTSVIFERLEKMLGTTWGPEDVREGKKGGEAPDKVFVPLSVAINSGILKVVRNILGVTEGSQGQQILDRMYAASGQAPDQVIAKSVEAGTHEELGDLETDDFKSFFGAVGIMHENIVAARQQMNEQSEDGESS